jgi:hypothetical protein
MTGWRTGLIKKALVVLGVVTAAAILIVGGMAGSVLAAGPCPWTITEVGVGKHKNGDKQTETYVKGSFPTGIDERPDWYINGALVGKSYMDGEGRWIPDSSSHFKRGDNIVMVKFNKPPYYGASFRCRIKLFIWLSVSEGGMRWYSCE